MTDAEHLVRAREFQTQGKMEEAIIEAKNAIQKNPQSGEARWLLGEIYADQGKGPEAEKELLKAEDLGIGMESLKAALALAYIAQGKYEEVLQRIEPSQTSSQENTAKILSARARAQRGLRKDDEACALFVESAKASPNYVEAYWGLAWCALTKEKPDEARAQLEAALKIDEKNAGTWALLGDVERSQKRMPEAEAAYTKALSLQPENTKARLGRAAVFIDAKKFAEAKKDVDAVLAKDKENAEALHLRGVSLYHQGNFQDAKTSLEQALRHAKDPAPTQLWLGLTNLSMGNMELASDHLARFTRAVPGALDAKALLAYIDARRGGTEQAKATLDSLKNVQFKEAQTLVALGSAFMLVGDGASSSKYFKQAVEQNPNAAEPRVQLATALLQGGDEKEAVEQLQKAIQLDPTSKQAEQTLVLTLLRQKKFDEALSALERAAVKHSKEAWPLNLRGAVLVEKGDTAGAAQAYKRGLEIEPGNPASTHSLALLALKGGKPDEARGWYQKSLDKDPDHWQSLLALAGLEQRAGRAAEAQQLLERAAQKHSAQPAVALTLGRFYLAGGDPRKALSATEAASERVPNDNDLLTLRGAAYAALRDLPNARNVYERLAKVAAKPADAHYRLATLHAMAKDSKLMRGELNRALEVEPAHVPALMALARLDMDEGKLTDAARSAEKLQQARPKAAETALLQAELALKQRNSQLALAKLDEAAAQTQAAVETRFTLAQRYIELGQAARAVPIAQQLLAASPNRTEFVDLLGQAQLAATQPGEAAKSFERLAALMPRSPAVQLRIANAKRAARDFAGAEAALKTALSMKADQPEVKVLLAQTYAQSGRQEEALLLARELQRESPRSPLGHTLEGDLLLAQKKSAEAVAKYQSAYAQRADATLAIKLYEARAAGKPDPAAAAELERWVREHPKDATPRLYLGGIFLAAKDYEKAIGHYQALAKENPGNVVALNNLAWALHEAAKPGALQAAEQAYRLAPDNPNLQDTYGFMLAENGKVKEGIELLRKASAAAPNQPEIRYHLAAALAKGGEKGAASLELKRLLEANADFPSREKAKRLFESL